MTPSSVTDPDLDTIIGIALEIAQHCPDCADKAMRISSLARHAAAAPLDRETVRDAIEAQTFDSDLSDTQVSATTEAVVKVSRDAI